MTCGGKDTIVQSVGAYAPVDRRKAGGGDPFAAPHEAGIGTKEPSSECLPMSVDWGAAEWITCQATWCPARSRAS
jgi:hypothetical protein